MARVQPLFEAGPITLPLSGGACLRLTPFRESAQVALTVHDRAGSELGGIVLGTGRARLLARWLALLADQCGDERTDAPRPRRLAARGR